MRIDRNLIRQEVSVYARTLLDAAREAGCADEVSSQLEDIQRIIRGKTEFRNALLDESIPAEKRGNIVREVFKEANPLVVKTLGVMAERGNIGLLSRVIEEYDLALEEGTGVITVDVTTAVPLDDATRELVRKKMSADFDGKEITLQEHVDKSILGGIILDAHGKRIDASVHSKLEKARAVLSSVPGGER